MFGIIRTPNRASYRIFLTIFDKVFPLTRKSVLNIAAHENILEAYSTPILIWHFNLTSVVPNSKHCAFRSKR